MRSIVSNSSSRRSAVSSKRPSPDVTPLNAQLEPAYSPSKLCMMLRAVPRSCPASSNASSIGTHLRYTGGKTGLLTPISPHAENPSSGFSKLRLGPAPPRHAAGRTSVASSRWNCGSKTPIWLGCSAIASPTLPTRVFRPSAWMLPASSAVSAAVTSGGSAVQPLLVRYTLSSNAYPSVERKLPPARRYAWNGS